MAAGILGARADRPRRAAIAGLAAIALASAVALAWPLLPWGSAPGRHAGVVLRTLPDATAEARVGKRAPDFEWADPSGVVHRLSELQGKTVVLNFWATWCVACREEMPALDRAARADPSLVVIALDLDESADRIDGFIESYAIGHSRAVLDAGKKVATRYGVVFLPITFFIGPDGTVRHVELSPMDDRLIQSGIARAR